MLGKNFKVKRRHACISSYFASPKKSWEIERKNSGKVTPALSQLQSGSGAFTPPEQMREMFQLANVFASLCIFSNKLRTTCFTCNSGYRYLFQNNWLLNPDIQLLKRNCPFAISSESNREDMVKEWSQMCPHALPIGCNFSVSPLGRKMELSKNRGLAKKTKSDWI